MGVDHVIRHRPRARGTVWRENGEIHVAGQIEHLPRRVEDWLRQQIRRELERRSLEKAAEIGKTVKSITIRDPRSEEHTSELQSLMRNTYAVFWLKKKKKKNRIIKKQKKMTNRTKKDEKKRRIYREVNQKKKKLQQK